MKIKTKICVFCKVEKNKREFPQTDRGSGTSEYCNECGEKYKNHLFLMNKNNIVIDVLTQDEADTLLLNEIITFKKGKYTVSNEAEYLEKIKGKISSLKENDSVVLAVGKYNEKRKAVSKSIAEKMVEEGAAVWGNETTIRHLFSGKELEQLVVKRDNAVCYYCKGKGDRITFLVSRSQYGLLSPKNSICCCKACKESEGENLYFYQWINVPVFKEENEERESLDEVYTMVEKRKQTAFKIKREHAIQLVEEEMAVFTEGNNIQILYDQKEFRELIFKRDNNICIYCKKKGSTIDHIIPQINGGMTTPKNCILACHKCNEKKSDLDQEVFIQKKQKK